MNFTLLVTSIVLFNYINKLMINNNYYHQSIGWNKIAFMIQPGLYITNADHVEVIDGVESLQFSSHMNKICNRIAEKIEYYHWIEHDIWIIWGGGTLWFDGNKDGYESDGGVIIRREEPGWHSVMIDVVGCHDPKLLIGGRFLELLIINITKEIRAEMKGYKFNPLLLYNAEHIITY